METLPKRRSIRRIAKKHSLKVLNQYLRQGKLFFLLLKYAFLSVVAFVFLYPFLYMAITSFKSPSDLFNSMVNWVPRELYFRNYVRAFDMLGIPRHLLISIGITLTSIVLRCLICSFIGYGFARYNFPGKKFWFAIVILTIIIPTQTIQLPQYLEFNALGWVGTYLPILIPQLFGYGLRGGLFIFLFRQFFLNMPKSLEEAARIDGCGFFKIFFRIALPAVRTSTVVCAVLAMVWHWNDYSEISIYVTNPAQWPITARLPVIYNEYLTFFGNAGSMNNMVRPEMLTSELVTEGTVMAATVMVILPVLIAYMILQKQFVQGIERSGLVE